MTGEYEGQNLSIPHVYINIFPMLPLIFHYTKSHQRLYIYEKHRGKSCKEFDIFPCTGTKILAQYKKNCQIMFFLQSMNKNVTTNGTMFGKVTDLCICKF